MGVAVGVTWTENCNHVHNKAYLRFASGVVPVLAGMESGEDRPPVWVATPSPEEYMAIGDGQYLRI